MWDQSCSTRLIIKNSVGGPRNVFVRFSLFLINIAFVSRHSTNRLVILLERHYVLYKVRSQSWDIMYISQVFVRSLMGKMASRQIFLRLLQFSSVLSFHQCATLIFVLIIILSERQAGGAWKTVSFRKSGDVRHKRTFILPWMTDVFCIFYFTCLVVTKTTHLNMHAWLRRIHRT